MLSVITPLTNFLKLPLINKKPVGVAAQGKPQAIFQLVSPERQIGILHSTLREESGNKNKGGAEDCALLKSTLQGQRKRGRHGRQAGRRTVKDAEAGISFLWGEQIK